MGSIDQLQRFVSWRMKKKSWILLSIVIIPILILIGFYVWVFHGQNISVDGEKWAAFSTYFQLPALIANTAVITYISFLVYKSGIDRDEFQAKYLKAAEMPIIAFCEMENDIYAVNIGKGAALNIMFLTTENGTDFINETDKYYSLAPKGKMCINWLGKDILLKCLYEDIFSMDNNRQAFLFTTYDGITNSFKTLKSKDYDTYDNEIKKSLTNYKIYQERPPLRLIDKWPFQI